MKKIKAIVMSVMIMLLMMTVTGKEVKADLTDTTLGQGITSVSIRDTSTLSAIDPASFYSVMGDMILDLKFEDGQSLELDRWQLAYSLDWDGGDNYNYVSRGYISNPYYDYVIYMYDANGEQVFLDYDFFEVGEGYVLKFYRGYNQTNLIFEQKINIAAPESFEEITDGKVEFKTANPDKFETVWYPIPADTKLNTEYKISRVDFSEDEIWRNHISLWKYENGQATRINEGLQAQDEQTFAHTFTELENVYLVIGEKEKSMNISGTIAMKEKRTLESIELKPYTCSVWNDGQYRMPVTVRYTDGSTDTYIDWLSKYGLENANGDGQAVYVNGGEMTTPNGDALVLGFQDKAGNWIEIGNSREWKAGTYKVVAYLLNDRNNCVESTITVEEPKAAELDLDAYQTDEFAVTAGNVKYYKFVTDDEKSVLLINNSENKLYYSSYSRTPGSDEAWDRYYNEYEVDGNESIRFKGGKEYLFIVYSDIEATGTIGCYDRYSEVKKAEVTIDELDLTDVTIWNRIPIKISHVSVNDSSLQTGWQILNDWEVRSYSSEANTFTVYGERIYYVLYRNGEEYDIPNENTIDKLRCGDYEIKVYKETVDDANLIGSKKIKTNFTHEWEEIDYVPATCSSEGAIEYWCSKCRQRKRDVLPKTGHDYGDWITDEEATCTDKGRVSRKCSRCEDIETDNLEALGHIEVEDKAKEATCTELGRTGGSHCSRCEEVLKAQEIIEALGHDYGEWTTEEKATCTEEGSQSRECSRCEDIQIGVIEAIGHNYSSSWTIDKKATTTANGSKSKHCYECGAKTNITTIRKASKGSLSTAAYTYNGKQKSPTVTIKDSNGKVIAAANYTLTKPAGRKNVGKYTYKINFKNEYSGTKNLTLTINPKGTTVSSLTKASKAFTVKWKKQSEKMAAARISGYEIQYSTNKKFTSSKKTTVKGYGTVSKKVTGLKAKTTYYVRIRTYKTVTVNGKSEKLYSGWSATKSVKTK